MGKRVELSQREKLQADVLGRYVQGGLPRREAQSLLGLSTSSFYRRLSRFRSAGQQGLVHTLRGRRQKQWAPARQQVFRLYRKGPSLFCSHFYRLHAHKFPRPLGYSTVRRWLRQRGLLVRPPRGVRVTRRQVWEGRVVEGRPILSGQGGRARSRPWRRRRQWELRERWLAIWQGWEKPGYGMRVPTPQERRRDLLRRRPFSSLGKQRLTEQQQEMRQVRRVFWQEKLKHPWGF